MQITSWAPLSAFCAHLWKSVFPGLPTLPSAAEWCLVAAHLPGLTSAPPNPEPLWFTNVSVSDSWLSTCEQRWGGFKKQKTSWALQKSTGTASVCEYYLFLGCFWLFWHVLQLFMQMIKDLQNADRLKRFTSCFLTHCLLFSGNHWTFRYDNTIVYKALRIEMHLRSKQPWIKATEYVQRCPWKRDHTQTWIQLQRMLTCSEFLGERPSPGVGVGLTHAIRCSACLVLPA